ncbi:hypothetical protein VP01_748g9 [Puccinia sorghi]|uniref:Uncharacterized protein n=1 Tax=Puccinia sorghi TaxID=27349 RepID=A0A0L6UCB4_9BASI|nr:hypothetical protein VP01_748g9 [Puccinia sorghi]
MVIGCSILDDTGKSDFQPLYLAARMGALGGPIAALFCVLISAALSQEALEDTIEPVEVVLLRQKVEAPYVIGVGGGPIGSVILHSANLAHSISPTSAAQATSIGGLFATPIYYIFVWLIMTAMTPFMMDEVLEMAETDIPRTRTLSSV